MRGSSDQVSFPEPQQISAQIRDQIRDMIVTGQLSEGERIVETTVAQWFKVSRSPVREALHLLAYEGFIDLLPYRGAKVSLIKRNGVQEHYQIKAMLEGHASYLAASFFGSSELQVLEEAMDDMARQIKGVNHLGVENANYAFHRGMIEGIGNSIMTQYFEGFSHNLKRYACIALSREPHSWEEALAEHRLIYKAIKQQDPVASLQRAHEHAMQAMDRVLAKVAE